MSKRILVLEDDKKTLEFIEIILGGEGYDVIAINHYEPVTDVVDFGPELIILDVRLSNGYGHLLCKDLKANPGTSAIPVILVSGADNLEVIAKECNANDYLSKPFSVDDLINIVKKYK